MCHWDISYWSYNRVQQGLLVSWWNDTLTYESVPSRCVVLYCFATKLCFGKVKLPLRSTKYVFTLNTMYIYTDVCAMLTFTQFVVYCPYITPKIYHTYPGMYSAHILVLFFHSAISVKYSILQVHWYICCHSQLINVA